MDLPEHELSNGRWAARQVAWGGCAYVEAAGKALQRDCVRWTLDNIVAAEAPERKILPEGRASLNPDELRIRTSRAQCKMGAL